jgi:predicted DNA-binding protein
MRVLLDIKDAKALHLLEVLKSLPYVKTTTLTEEKAQLLEDLKESVDTLNQVKKGEIKLKSARDLFNEL